jgi:hypothetical protein
VTKEAEEMQSEIFTDEILDALGAWQRGWKADEELKKPIADKLVREARKLPAKFRTAPPVCFRKRFLFKKDMEPLVMFGGLDDGVASWSADRAFAMDFKGLIKPEAVTAAYFEHRPLPEEVIVNFVALWDDQGFREAAEDYRRRWGREANALFNFTDKQSEIVLHARLHAREVKGMVAESPPFDAACDEAGIVGEDARDRIFNGLTEREVFFGVPRWSSEEGAQRVLANTRRKFLTRNAALIELAAALRRKRQSWLRSVSYITFRK